jgi:hypothetical protein
MQKAQGTLSAIQMYRGDDAQYKEAKLAGLVVPDITDLGVQKAEADLQRATTEYQAITNSIAVNLGELQKYGVAYDQATGQLGMLQSVADELATIRTMPVGGGNPPPKSTSSGALGPGLVKGGFAGTPKPGGGNVLGKQINGTNGSVKMVPSVKEVFKGHWDHGHAPGAHKFDFTIIDKNDQVLTAVPSPVTGEVTDVYYEPGY